MAIENVLSDKERTKLIVDSTSKQPEKVNFRWKLLIKPSATFDGKTQGVVLQWVIIFVA